ncbi:hypothetical protein ABT317_35295, partial [Streptomyces carpinensis]
MHRASRAAAPRAFALLTAVLLTLLSLLAGLTTSDTDGARPDPPALVHAAPAAAAPPEAPPAAQPEPRPAGHHTAPHDARTPPHAHTAPHADEQCPDACTTQAGARHELHGERPAPPGHLATTTTD